MAILFSCLFTSFFKKKLWWCLTWKAVFIHSVSYWKYFFSTQGKHKENLFFNIVKIIKVLSVHIIMHELLNSGSVCVFICFYIYHLYLSSTEWRQCENKHLKFTPIFGTLHFTILVIIGIHFSLSKIDWNDQCNNLISCIHLNWV